MKRMLRRISALTAAATTIFCGTPATASTSTGGVISHVLVLGGKVFFDMSGSRSTVPSCATIPGRWVFDASNPSGQAMMSAMLTMEARGVRVAVAGTGACTDWGDTESVNYIEELP